ncbi:MAG: nitronate monooxygenase [Melioribacteraceae bacterium]|nr:nitronate monooxygenase [Melioribacteraceae bacterium]
MKNNRVTELLGIKYPIVQAGMVWTSGWRLASAVSNNGGLGLIGSGSMKADLLREHIQKCKAATDKPFGVNLTLLRGDIEELINVTIDEGVKIAFSSAGHPGKFIDRLKNAGMVVVHVVPSLKFALKAESVGCDAVVGEGVEAGGHNGADQITLISLIPKLVDELKIPVIAAGGIADGRGIAAAMALGAEGVQIGTRFAATLESSSHENYKRRVVEAEDNDTTLILSKIGLVRTLKNDFTKLVADAENKGADEGTLRELLGAKRERKGIFEGDEDEGLMEAGQGAALIKEILPVEVLMKKLVEEYNQTVNNISSR